MAMNAPNASGIERPKVKFDKKLLVAALTNRGGKSTRRASAAVIRPYMTSTRTKVFTWISRLP